MSGVAVVRYLLTQASAITTVIPAARIIAGVAPLGTAKPFIQVSEVSSNKAFRSVRTSESGKYRRERVQVTATNNGPLATVPGLGYPQVKALLKLARTACENKRGTINTFSVDSITDEGEGSDLSDDATQLYSQSTDFFVNWSD